jgi:hypothetical protein
VPTETMRASTDVHILYILLRPKALIMDEGLSYPAFARGRGGAAPCPNGYLLNFSKELNPSSILYILFFMADATNRLSKSHKKIKKNGTSTC